MLQIAALIQAADALRIELVVRKIEHLKSSKIFVTEWWNLSDRVELQVQVLQVLEVAQLLHADLVVGQVKRGQVLEVA